MEQFDNDAYRELHQKLILQPTRREREQQKTILQFNAWVPGQNQSRSEWNKKEMRVYFTFESGPMLPFKRELHRLWKKHYIYDGSPMNDVTLQIGTRNNKSLQQLLIKNKPPRSMLVSNNRTTTE